LYASAHVTVSETVAECVSVPEVPVIVIVYVPAGVPVVGKPLQLVSENISSAAMVHASFRAIPIRRTIHTNIERLMAISPSDAFQIPVVGRESMRNAIDGALRAVVLIVPIEVTPADVGVTELGLNEQLEPAGAPVQVSATADVKPFNPFTVAVVFAAVPAAMLTLVGNAVTVKSGLVDVPVPVSVAVCGLLASLSATLNVAVMSPAAFGVNVTLIVQLAPAASVAPHALVCAKEDADAPARLTTMFFTVAVLLFFSVTVCAALVVLSP
jgi:hypothetical protein